MKTIFAFCIALLGFTGTYAQTTTANPDQDKVFTVVQTKPEFPGSVSTWLSDNIVYPSDARAKNIQGTVYIQFVVEKDGSVSSAKVLRGVDSGKVLNDEALKVVSMMPKWTPGYQNGHTVRVAYVLPIRFMLTDDNTPGQKKN